VKDKSEISIFVRNGQIQTAILPEAQGYIFSKIPPSAQVNRGKFGCDFRTPKNIKISLLEVME
jgi:hypothetical protein